MDIKVTDWLEVYRARKEGLLGVCCLSIDNLWLINGVGVVADKTSRLSLRWPLTRERLPKSHKGALDAVRPITREGYLKCLDAVRKAWKIVQKDN